VSFYLVLSTLSVYIRYIFFKRNQICLILSCLPSRRPSSSTVFGLGKLLRSRSYSSATRFGFAFKASLKLLLCTPCLLVSLIRFSNGFLVPFTQLSSHHPAECPRAHIIFLRGICRSLLLWLFQGLPNRKHPPCSSPVPSFCCQMAPSDHFFS
jgi:hypothetical protein